eukprot:3782252-Prymnesium_polylepis.1
MLCETAIDRDPLEVATPKGAAQRLPAPVQGSLGAGAEGGTGTALHARRHPLHPSWAPSCEDSCCVPSPGDATPQPPHIQGYNLLHPAIQRVRDMVALGPALQAGRRRPLIRASDPLPGLWALIDACWFLFSHRDELAHSSWHRAGAFHARNCRAPRTAGSGLQFPTCARRVRDRHNVEAAKAGSIFKLKVLTSP